MRSIRARAARISSEQGLQLVLGGGGEAAGQQYAQHQVIAEVMILGLGGVEGGGMGTGALLLGQAPVDGGLVGLARPGLGVTGPVLVIPIEREHGLPKGQGDGLGSRLSTSTGLLAVASPWLRESRGVTELLGLAQADQLLTLAGGEAPGRDADDEQHEQG